MRVHRFQGDPLVRLRITGSDDATSQQHQRQHRQRRHIRRDAVKDEAKSGDADFLQRKKILRGNPPKILLAIVGSEGKTTTATTTDVTTTA